MTSYGGYNGREHKLRRRRGGSAQKSQKDKKSSGLGFAVFAAAIGTAALIRTAFPAFSTELTDKLLGNSDIRAAFTVLGEGLTGEREFSNAVYEAYEYAFNPAEEPVSSDVPVFEELPQLPEYADVQTNALASEFALPVMGSVAQGFGQDGDGFSYGTSVLAPTGSVVRAFSDGEVTAIGDSKTKGQYLVISHGGFVSEYSGLAEIYVSSGDDVSAGDAIALSGEREVFFELMTDDGYLDAERFVSWT